MSEPQSKRRMDLVDDGTLDTVFKCGDCGGEERYNFLEDYAGEEESDDEREYKHFLEWALSDAEEQHECQNEEEN